ncbi:hypothetical protein HE1_00375 [Holospora elegans E1]|uniref:Uncharacterized protein n=1 Tax=Holospora elegans E1 TaxID=1427503 RepID=A0A023DXZ5_9PROT|nr:hypothetical protein HE1_00375 [Holospora elegans E1]
MMTYSVDFRHRELEIRKEGELSLDQVWALIRLRMKCSGRK